MAPALVFTCGYFWVRFHCPVRTNTVCNRREPHVISRRGLARVLSPHSTVSHDLFWHRVPHAR